MAVREVTMTASTLAAQMSITWVTGMTSAQALAAQAQLTILQQTLSLNPKQLQSGQPDTLGRKTFPLRLPTTPGQVSTRGTSIKAKPQISRDHQLMLLCCWESTTTQIAQKRPSSEKDRDVPGMESNPFLTPRTRCARISFLASSQEN